MASKTTVTFQYALRTHYTSEFNKDLLEKDNDTLKRFFANRQPAGGKDITTPIRVRRAAGSTGGITETGATKTAAEPTDTTVIDNLKIVETTKEVSQLAINVSKGKEHAYLKALDDLNSDAVTEHADHLNKVLFNTGGYWAQCSSCSTLTITLATGMNSRMFYVGQTVAILVKSTGATGSGHAGTTVTAVNHTNNTVTVTAIGNAANIDSTYWICDTNNVTNGTTTSLIPYGLPDLISTTTGIHGVSTTTYPEWISQLVNGASGDLTPELIQQLVDEIEIYNHGKIAYFLCHDKLMRKYQWNIVEPQVTRQPGDGTVGSGELYFRGRSKQRIPILTAAYCSPTDDFYAIDSSAIVPYASAFSEWMDDDGKVLSRKVGYYTYEAVMSTELQNIAYARFKLGKIYDLDIT